MALAEKWVTQNQLSPFSFSSAADNDGVSNVHIFIKPSFLRNQYTFYSDDIYHELYRDTEVFPSSPPLNRKFLRINLLKTCSISTVNMIWFSRWFCWRLLIPLRYCLFLNIQLICSRTEQHNNARRILEDIHDFYNQLKLFNVNDWKCGEFKGMSNNNAIYIIMKNYSLIYFLI